ncbi:hypothetical protein WMY93_016465 [Mugilogobius chulae]|uniref:Uncharacterized protein n=1 Tax=Mugilogobius chulae TaxID=88201 RepID=A0AAW0NNA0_9GOBI
MLRERRKEKVREKWMRERKRRVDGRFQLEVCVEYVKRLIRADKLKDAKRQEEAHNSLQRDAELLQQLFCRMGSQEEWLKDVLIKIAELLKLQDLAAVQMHVISMGTSYPDISEKHVSAILNSSPTSVNPTDKRSKRHSGTRSQNLLLRLKLTSPSSHSSPFRTCKV